MLNGGCGEGSVLGWLCDGLTPCVTGCGVRLKFYASDEAVSARTSDVSFMIVFSLLLIVPETGVVMADLTLRDRRCPLVEQGLQRIPSSTFPEILPFPGNGAQGLQHHSIRQRGSDVGVVVWRADLDHVHPDDRQLETDPAYRVQQFACRQPARFRRTGAGCMTWIAHINVD